MEALSLVERRFGQEFEALFAVSRLEPLAKDSPELSSANVDLLGAGGDVPIVGCWHDSPPWGMLVLAYQATNLSSEETDTIGYSGERRRRLVLQVLCLLFLQRVQGH